MANALNMHRTTIFRTGHDLSGIVCNGQIEWETTALLSLIYSLCYGGIPYVLLLQYATIRTGDL